MMEARFFAAKSFSVIVISASVVGTKSAEYSAVSLALESLSLMILMKQDR